MQLEEFFDFQRFDDIRIKGTRIGIESVLYEYTHRGQTPEEIAARFPTVTLEQVYATILFYLHNKETVSAYLADWLEWGRFMREAQEREPHSGIIQLREAQDVDTFIVKPDLSVKQTLDDLILIACASLEHELADRITFLPVG